MGLYDIEVSNRIENGASVPKTKGYLMYTTEDEIVELDSLDACSGKLVTAQDIEDLIYAFCHQTIADFAATPDNVGVYCFSLYIDSTYGSVMVYLNNVSSLEAEAQSAYEGRKRSNEKNHDQSDKGTYEQVVQDLKHSLGNAAFIFDVMPEELDQVTDIYYNFSNECAGLRSVSEPVIFEKSIMDGSLYTIAIQVVKRLNQELALLDQTEDFIAYVSSADGDGGDYLTLGPLIRQTVAETTLYQAMPELKKKDEEYARKVAEVKQEPFEVQWKHWLSALSGGEFSENSLMPYWKNDWYIYKQLLELGKPLIPLVQKQLVEEEPDSELRLILERLLADLKSQ